MTFVMRTRRDTVTNVISARSKRDGDSPLIPSRFDQLIVAGEALDLTFANIAVGRQRTSNLFDQPYWPLISACRRDFNGGQEEWASRNAGSRRGLMVSGAAGTTF
jgi:hypothetical protein